MINFAVIITIVSFNTKPPLWGDFLKMEPGFDPSQTPTQNPVGFRVSITILRITMVLLIPLLLDFLIIKEPVWALGVCTFGATCYVAYITHLSLLETQKLTVEAQKESLALEENNRLKRLELAKQYPKDAANIFSGFPNEYDQFKNPK